MNKKLAATALSMSLSAAAPTFAEDTKRANMAQPLTIADIRAVSPALGKYSQTILLDEIWKRPGMSPRDRSVVTIAALIARGQTIEMPFYFELALDNGVTAGELSEIITHLAFYAGFPQATAAVAVAKNVFAARGITGDQLPPENPELLPINQAAEDSRAKSVAESVGPISQGVVDYTAMLFQDVWQRPGLAPRDRSLVTVASLITNGQSAQVGFHLNKAMDNGLTATEASELLTTLAFYAGWPNVFSAVPVAKDVIENRPS
ncbi:4-carboxymuconolactone decarboxylase [Rhizobium sp. BIGb0125]|uniref:carboxymuconolactone decarboxylase family protein n=1 Tax=Rhizobium sp. BIGb0125 TaxID=2940618 RepID=UPI002169523C|nr:carboxymuconolactone decarboxylase family protein [Rhizobium sp. BIGb0125]MCS4242643.1 4-carboxymuconolactone decarboxylase [Rhizobium sp. BIGb0125]